MLQNEQQRFPSVELQRQHVERRLVARRQPLQRQHVAGPAGHPHQGRAADGAVDGRQLAAHVAHQHGEPGAHQAGAQAATQPGGRLQVPPPQARAHFPPRGQSQEPQGRELGAEHGAESAQGARVPAQGAGHGARQLGLPDHERHHHAGLLIAARGATCLTPSKNFVHFEMMNFRLIFFCKFQFDEKCP